MLNIEHPEISWIERTGYPSFAQPQEMVCENCGEDITDEDWYEDENYDYLCKHCLLTLHLKR